MMVVMFVILAVRMVMIAIGSAFVIVISMTMRMLVSRAFRQAEVSRQLARLEIEDCCRLDLGVERVVERGERVNLSYARFHSLQFIG